MDVMIMKIESIAGESQLKGYETQIELLSYSHGVAMQVTSDVSNKERTSGKPNHQEFTISKYMDISSTSLIDACNKATNLGTITVTVGRNDAGAVLPFMVYSLENALISSASVGSGGGDKATETVTLNYTKISWVYNSQKPGSGKEGEAKANWSLAQNASE